MKKEFDVYFSGEVLDGHDLEQVKEAVGRIFKIDGARLEALFTGKPVRIKKNLSVEKAGKFRKLFRDSGALVQIVPAGEAPPPPGAAPSPRIPPRPEPPFQQNRPTPPPQAQQPQPTSQDTAPLSGDSSEDGAARFDTSGLSLAPMDDTPHDPRARRQVQADLPDISHLEVLPQEKSSLEDCARETPPAPIPDIGGLSLEEN